MMMMKKMHESEMTMIMMMKSLKRVKVNVVFDRSKMRKRNLLLST